MCGVLERHRLSWLYFKERTSLFKGPRKRLLDIAPEPGISGRIRRSKYVQYLSIDLTSSFAMVKMSVTNLQFPDNSFDAIYCSHVLEHVPEDRRAMGEFYRILKPGGWAIILVPVSGDVTLEDSSVTTPEKRARVFGQHDHVRMYGKDLKERLEGAGFKVVVDSFARIFTPRQVKRLGLKLDDDIYFCSKAIRTIL